MLAVPGLGAMPLLLLWWAALQPAPEPRLEKRDQSSCHIYIDEQVIWTVEIVEEFDQPPVPIVNIITFEIEEAPLKPEQIRLFNPHERTAEVKRFAIETGFEPYLTSYLRVLPSSFIGFDLEGKFEGFSEPVRVVIELAETEYALQAVDCLDYEMLAQRINKVNFDSPDVREDFAILRIPHVGSRSLVRKGRR